MPTPVVPHPSLSDTRLLQIICGALVDENGNIRPITGAGSTWGLITGTLSDQTDLQAALNAKQNHDATLDALAALTITANSLTIGTGADAFSQTAFGANTFPARASSGNLAAKTITDFGLSLVDDADATTARSTLGLGSIAVLSSISLTGDVTGSGSSSIATTIAPGVVTFAKMATAAWSDDVTMAGDSSTVFPTQHAAKTYADNLKAALKWKQDCIVATTVNVNISSAPASIDSVTLTSGDRVLLMGQTTGGANIQNGSYVFNGTGSAMTRTTDGDTGAELVSATFPIRQGTYADTWQTVTNDSITIGSTPIVFTQTAGAGTYVAGIGLTLTGNSFSLATGVINPTGNVIPKSDGTGFALVDSQITDDGNLVTAGALTGDALLSLDVGSKVATLQASSDIYIGGTGGRLHLADLGNGVLNQTSGQVGTYDSAGLGTFLGLGSNAYTSTDYLPLTGGTLSGLLTITATNPSLTLGVSSTSGGSVKLFGGTSGFTIIQPAPVAGSGTITLPNATSTLPIFAHQTTFVGLTGPKTITLPDANFTVARTDAGNTFSGGNNVFTGTVGVTPSSGAASLYGQIPTSADYCQFGMKDQSGTQKFFFGFVGSGATGGLSGRAGHAEIGTVSTALYIRPGDSADMFAFTTAGNLVIGGSSGNTDLALNRNAAGLLEVNSGTAGTLRDIIARAFVAGGSATTCTGATIGTGSKSNAGFVTATTSGTSTVVVTFPFTAPTGWVIYATNLTADKSLRQSASTTTTATFTGATTSGDVINYIAFPY